MPNRPVGTGKAQDCQFLRGDTNLDRHPLLIRAVIDRVDQSLFESGGKRTIPESLGLRLLRVLDLLFP